MNTGPIAHRYAKALLKLVQETGAGEKVYSQACVLVLRMQEVSQLTDVIQKHPEVDLDRKLEILGAAVGEPLADDLSRFVRLVCENRRIDLLLRMLASFLDQYRAFSGIKVGRLVTACPSPHLKHILENLMHEKTGAMVQLDESVDETLIGGFVLQIDDLRMDASVQTQLRRLHNELVDKANRIV
jgi:F-type H+-transporting ATPase subunit delta